MARSKQPTQKALQALGAALKVERARARKTQDQMCKGHGFTGSALARWELGNKPNGPSQVKLDKAMGWEPGTVRGFLEGKLKTIEDVDHPRNGRPRYVSDMLPEDEHFGGDGDAEPLNNDPMTDGGRQQLAPNDKEEARRALAVLLNSAMSDEDPNSTPFTIEVRMPIYWDTDRTLKVAKAAAKLAQQAIDAYAAQQG